MKSIKLSEEERNKEEPEMFALMELHISDESHIADTYIGKKYSVNKTKEQPSILWLWGGKFRHHGGIERGGRKYRLAVHDLKLDFCYDVPTQYICSLSLSPWKTYTTMEGAGQSGMWWAFGEGKVFIFLCNCWNSIHKRYLREKSEDK